MKQIVFVIESLHFGGAERSLVTLLQNLDYNQYKVDLIVFIENGVFKDLIPEQVNYINVGFPIVSIIDRFKYLLIRRFKKEQHNAQALWSIINNKFQKIDKSYDFAIAYNQGFATYFVDKYIQASKKYSWLNTDYNKAGYNIGFDYPIYKNFDCIIAVSNEVKEVLKLELKKIEKQLNIQVIKDITDQKVIQMQANLDQEHAFNNDKINIVSVGRLVSYKGFNLAIMACKALVNKGYPIKWYIIGEGNERQNLEKMIKINKLENYIYLIGAKINPYPYMKSSSIYVQTSLFEGLGLTVIEASYLNKPIVSTNFNSIYSILKDEETGLIAEMNAESIAAKIERLIIDDKLRNLLSNNLAKIEHFEKEESLNKVKILFNS